MAIEKSVDKTHGTSISVTQPSARRVPSASLPGAPTRCEPCPSRRRRPCLGAFPESEQHLVDTLVRQEGLDQRPLQLNGLTPIPVGGNAAWRACMRRRFFGMDISPPSEEPKTANDKVPERGRRQRLHAPKNRCAGPVRGTSWFADDRRTLLRALTDQENQAGVSFGRKFFGTFLAGQAKA
jgi:hypothetical protein